MKQDLMQKLVLAKQIMDRHGETPRGSAQSLPSNMVESFEVPEARYNVPQEFLAEQPTQKVNQQHVPIQVTNSRPTKDRIMNSKLPDEIKKLMMEHPIEQPAMAGSQTVLSDELVEAASRLMKTNASGGIVKQEKKQLIQETKSNINIVELKQMLRETIEEVLTEKGLVVESTERTKEQISLRVGQHLFEGVLTKIKKMK
jgi:hypothetical protein